MYWQSSQPKLLAKAKLHNNPISSQKCDRTKRQQLKINISKYQQDQYSELTPRIKNLLHDQRKNSQQKISEIKFHQKLNKPEWNNKFDIKGILQMHQFRQRKQQIRKCYINNSFKRQGYSIGLKKKVGLDMIIPSFQAFNINSDRLPGFIDLSDNDNKSLSRDSRNQRPKSQKKQIRGLKRPQDRKQTRQRSQTHHTKQIKLQQYQHSKQLEKKEHQQFKLKSFATEIYWNNKKKDLPKQLYTQYSMYERKQETKFRSKNVQNIIRRRPNKSFFDSFGEYCRRMKVKQNEKVFVFQSSDLWLKQVLLERGWVQNQDKSSKFYHLKWGYKIQQEKVQKQQLINHFYDSDLLTSKIQLAKMIRKSKYLQSYSPRTYELGYQTSQFMINYNITQILCGLKQIIMQMERQQLLPQHIIGKQQLKKSLLSLIQSQNFQNESKIKSFVIHIPCALQLCAFCQNLRCQIEGQQKQSQLMLTQKSLKNLSSFSHLNPPYTQYVKYSSTQQQVKKDEKIQFNKKNINMYLTSFSFKYASQQLLELIYSYHKYLCQNYNTYQAEGTQNLWIVKNRNSSKGSGISIFNNIQEITKKTQNKIVQKYLQNCGLYGIKSKKQIKYYKYDLRVWVLVTSFNPLISYYYNNFYCRLCSQEYNTSYISRLQIHLTNYSKNRQNFNSQNRSSVLSYQQFINLAVKYEIDKSNEQSSDNQFQTDIQKNRKDKELRQKVIKKVDQKLQLLIYHTLSMYQDKIQSFPECFQLYGFDILVSNTFQFYLIEVNLSPACQDRQQWLSQNVRKMARGLLNIVVQHQQPQKSRSQGWNMIRSAQF